MNILPAINLFLHTHKKTIYIFLLLWLLIGCLICGYLFRSNYELQLPYKKIQFHKTSMGVSKVYAAEREIKPENVDMFDPEQIKAYIKQECIKKFGENEWDSLAKLLEGESGFRSYALNFVAGGDEGACGLFQSLPCRKLGPRGLDLRNQVVWGLGNIQKTYGTPSAAYNRWLARSPHWY